ncbi:flagellar protein FlaG [Nitrospira sp. Kam-Ns4a]
MIVEFRPESIGPIGGAGTALRTAGSAGAEPVAEGPTPRPTPEAVREAAARANQALEAGRVSVRFRVDQETDQIVVSVVNEATGEVVRQIPAEEQLAIEAHLQRMMGVLFSRTV